MLSPHGEIDLETAPLLREVLLPVLEREIGPVVLDLSEVAFMDSTGVHLLVEALRRLELQNRRLAIVCREGGQVHRLLAVVGLLDDTDRALLPRERRGRRRRATPTRASQRTARWPRHER